MAAGNEFFRLFLYLPVQTECDALSGTPAVAMRVRVACEKPAASEPALVKVGVSALVSLAPESRTDRRNR